jgi:hypothetical protein
MLKTTLLKSAVIGVLVCGSLMDSQAVMFNRFTCKNPDTAILAVLQDSNKGIPNCLKAAYEAGALYKAADSIGNKYGGLLRQLFVNRAYHMLGITENMFLSNRLAAKFTNLLTQEELLGILRGFLASNPSPSKEFYVHLTKCLIPPALNPIIQQAAILEDKFRALNGTLKKFTAKDVPAPATLTNEIQDIENQMAELEKEADKILAHHSRLPSLAAGSTQNQKYKIINNI